MILEPLSLTLMPRKLFPSGMQFFLERSELDIAVNLKVLHCNILVNSLLTLQFT